jgi:NAD(P)H-hydrate repair Nnr-like enzyme with NAD(P)H-hydrate dehydratase domain
MLTLDSTIAAAQTSDRLAAADAARLAVAVHGRAGAEVLASNRWQSLIASDLVGALPRVLNDLSRSVRDAPTGP